MGLIFYKNLGIKQKKAEQMFGFPNLFFAQAT